MTSGYGFGHLLIIWNEANQTGVKILDEQHRAFAAMINTLHYGLVVKQDRHYLQPCYNMVMGFAKTHFPLEIDMLKEAGYPLAREHQAQHERFIADSRRIRHEILHEGRDPEEFLEFLKHWWKVHILRGDLAYSAHLQAYISSQHRVITKR